LLRHDGGQNIFACHGQTVESCIVLHESITNWRHFVKITVTTPSGHIGNRVVNLLLESGAEITLLARNPAKLAVLKARGVRIVKGEQADPQAVAEAVNGADALLWVNPPAYTAADPIKEARGNAEAAASAIRKNPNIRVVLISSTGAEHSSGTGPIVTLNITEEILKNATKNLTILRCESFMENILGSLSTIVSQGAIYSIEPGDASFPQIATKDIATVAARELLSGQSGTKIIDLIGPETISHNQVAEILSRTLGKQVKHVVVSTDQLRAGLVAAGFSDTVASSFIEMSEAGNKGLLADFLGDERRKGTTTFEQFAREVVLPAYRAQTAPQAKVG
jgi:uncharacterized protein YbjT (DUF2867 family)